MIRNTLLRYIFEYVRNADFDPASVLDSLWIVFLPCSQLFFSHISEKRGIGFFYDLMFPSGKSNQLFSEISIMLDNQDWELPWLGERRDPGGTDRFLQFPFPLDFMRILQRGKLDDGRAISLGKMK